MAKSLLGAGLKEKLSASLPVIQVPSFNNFYSSVRDSDTRCLNPGTVVEYSKILGMTVRDVVNRQQFAFVLGGDCSILIGVMSGLKQKGRYGLVAIDAHADFYQPERSRTGELADMDLAIVTGRGPRDLININGLCPYVTDEHVIHIGQRDKEEADRYGSQDIRQTAIKCFDLAIIREKGIDVIGAQVADHVRRMDVDGVWIHFDTDVLDDQLNPAVQYRLPGGLQYEEVETIFNSLLTTGIIAGVSVSIFNPLMDTKGTIAKEITASLSRIFTKRTIETAAEAGMLAEAD